MEPPARLDAEPRLEPNPYVEDEAEAETEGEAPHQHTPASVAYRYRKWVLAGSSDITVVARTTVHAVSRKGGVPKYISAWTVHEWDPKLSGAFYRGEECAGRRASDPEVMCVLRAVQATSRF